MWFPADHAARILPADEVFRRIVCQCREAGVELAVFIPPVHALDLAGRLDGFTRRVYRHQAMIRRVAISKQAVKQLRKLPQHVVDNLMIWVAAVEQDGLEEVRSVPGYHDEPLKGHRAGQRSIRLSRAYRAIYEIKEDRAKFVSVEEVSKHDY